MMSRFGGGFRGHPGGGYGYGMRPRAPFAPHLFPLGGLMFAVFAIALVALVVFLYWRILQKAGFEGALALLALVPLVNVGLLAYLALADWPVSKELRERRLADTTAVAQTAESPAVPPPGGEEPGVATASASAPTEPIARGDDRSAE